MKNKFLKKLVNTFLLMIFCMSINAQKSYQFQHSSIAGHETKLQQKFFSLTKTKLNHPPLALSLKDSAYYFFWDTTSGTWPFSAKNLYAYDINNNLSNHLNQIWDGSIWENNHQFIYTYDVNNNETNATLQLWNGSSWDNYSKSLYTYDIYNNRIADFYQTWSGTIWTNNSQSFYTFDASNNQITGLIQGWTGTIWTDNYQFSNSFDLNNNEISHIVQYWNGTTWVNSQNVLNTYDVSNNRTNSIYQNWSGTVWENNNQNFFTYDVNNNITNQLNEIWDSTLWVNGSQMNNIFNANNYRTDYVIQIWDTASNGWSNYDSAHYYYHDITGITINNNSLFASNIYPNPFSSQTSIVFFKEQQNIIIKITDELGKTVKLINFTGQKLILDQGIMKEGVYFVQIISENKVIENKKIIIQ